MAVSSTVEPKIPFIDYLRRTAMQRRPLYAQWNTFRGDRVGSGPSTSANLRKSSSRAANASSVGRMQGKVEFQDCLERNFPLERTLPQSGRFRSSRLLPD